MGKFNDSPAEGNRKPKTTSEEEALKKNPESIPAEDKDEDKFSPGEADGYNADDFSTD